MKYILLALLVLLPKTIFALGMGDGFYVNSFADLVYGTIDYIITPVATFIIGFAIVWFIYNTLKFIKAGEKERMKYRDGMIWGIVGITVMVSMWGLVSIFQETFGIDPASTRVQISTSSPIQFQGTYRGSFNSNVQFSGNVQSGGGQSSSGGGVFSGLGQFWSEDIVQPVKNIFGIQ